MKICSCCFKKILDKTINDFNSSISFDKIMYKEDMLGRIAHAKMIGECGIIEKSEANKICFELNNILSDLNNNLLSIDESQEDIHTFTEAELTKRLGDTGKRLHTARSRNDQVVLDIKLYLKTQMDELITLIKNLIGVICDKALENTSTVMPGYTHMQRAQPISFAHHIMAYAEMLLRDISRLNDTKVRINKNLESDSLATYKIKRNLTSELLHFSSPTDNSLDSVSDRYCCLELCSDLSILMVHLSRFIEEIIMWCSWEFKFIELDDAFSTGSSMMPQKKNPDIAGLVKGKSGRVFGDLMGLLTVMKGLPLAYNKDMQEDKEAVFDAINTVKMCINSFTPMFKTMTVLKDNMRRAAAGGFINATDCADYLVKKGIPFRDAYKITGKLVSRCLELNSTLEELPIYEYKKLSNAFDDDIFKSISLENCLNNRCVLGGPAKSIVENHVEKVKTFLK